MPIQTLPTAPSSGGRLVAADGRTLPLRASRLTAHAGGGLARTRLEQRFENPHAEPLAVVYELPLPADVAVAAFAFQVGERRIEGQIDAREAARARFEQALVEGRSAALLEQDRDSLFRQEIGNIPPGAQIVAELEVDQPLAWIAGGCWEWRFPTTVAPRYLGAPGRVPDAERITVDVAQDALPARLELTLAIDERIADGGGPRSPSHALAVEAGGERTTVRLAAEHARMDRDLVVRWPVSGSAVGARLVTSRPAAKCANAGSAYGLLTLVPPAGAEAEPSLARELVVLIDTSGSMAGAPLDQARAVVSALVEALTVRDSLELIEFSNAPRRWRRRPARVSARRRADALRWIAQLEASGGTEMRSAVSAALTTPAVGGQRQVLLVSDGFIGFEREIVAEVLARLSDGARLHTLGVGAAANRSLTSAAARAGRGVEAIIGPDEDPLAAARRLLAATCAPRVVDLELSGTALQERAPERLPDLFDGAPARVSLALRPAGGALVVRGRTAEGRWSHELEVPPTATGAGRPEVVSRFGRERVEDLEMRAAAGEAGDALDAEIEALGRGFALATRRTSWVAVSSEPTVDPRLPMRRERVPHELPYATSVAGLGLRPAQDDTLSESSTGVMDLAYFNGLKRARTAPLGAITRSPSEPDPVRAGRIRLHGGGVLVIELEADGSEWHLPRKVLIEWVGEQRHWARVDGDQSTRTGAVAVGTWIRLRLLLPEHAPGAAPIGASLRLRGRKIELELS